MTANGELPRRFGAYVLTAELGRDALGSMFRAFRISGDRGFVRLRIFESPEISEDAVLDAIEENGEIHSYLKNPAIARGVHMDAVEGLPFLAWNEPNGRTLDALIAKAREQRRGIPIEHALLIAEKVATGLDHAYNTTLDGERTLHGLVWPGFVSISDDGETRLTGFGLAAGFFPSMSRPDFSREVAPYLAPEERDRLAIEKNSDVYSVGVLLFELLFGRLPSETDPLGDLKAAVLPAAAPPEATAVLRTCLSPSDSRYQSSGDLRRELGKILFSGPYSPSTFNLAFFLTSLFGREIEAENRARSREAALDLRPFRDIAPPALPSEPIATAPLPPPGAAANAPATGARRLPFAIGGALLMAAALAGTVYVITRRPPHQITPARLPARVLPIATPGSGAAPEPTSPPTSTMSEGQFKQEVARRVAAELKKLEEQMQKNKAAALASKGAPAGSERAVSSEPTAPAAVQRRETQPQAEIPAPAPPAEPTETTAPAPVPPIPSPVAEPRPSTADAAASNEAETPPKIARVVKPTYPPLALKARIGGIVVLRVLVSENGSVDDVKVLRGAPGGLTDAAASAVRKWTFQPARRNDQPVRAWTTIPIPFEP